MPKSYDGWRQRIADAVHEHALNSSHKSRYYSMIRRWTGAVLREAHRHPDRDQVFISLDAAMPLSKKYATLAAIHDECHICDFKFNDWIAESNPFRGDNPAPMLLYAQFKNMQVYTRDISDDEAIDVKRILDDVATDLCDRAGKGHVLKSAADGASEKKPPAGRRGDEITLAEVRQSEPTAESEQAYFPSRAFGKKIPSDTLSKAGQDGRIQRRRKGKGWEYHWGDVHKEWPHLIPAKPPKPENSEKTGKL